MDTELLIKNALKSQLPDPNEKVTEIVISMGIRNPKAPKVFSIMDKLNVRDYDEKVVVKWTPDMNYDEFRDRILALISDYNIYYAKAIYMKNNIKSDEFTLKAVSDPPHRKDKLVLKFGKNIR